MESRISPLLFLVATLAALSCLTTVAGNVFYVDGIKGNDTNEGHTIEKPFSTIQKCVNALGKPGDECHIRDGRYHEDVQIDAKTGSADAPIIIRGYKDEVPIIDGTIELKPKKWYEHGNGIYKAAIPRDVWQLFVDDVMMTNARWPNALWSDKTVFLNKHWAKSSPRSKRGLMIDNSPKNLANSGLNATGAMAILNIGSFNTFTAVVQSHAPKSNSFTYHDVFGDIKFKPKMNQYFLEDKLDFLDQAGEWFYDKNTKNLYVKTYDGNKPRNVRGKVQTYAFVITRSEHLVIKQMTFFATTLKALAVGKHSPVSNLTFHSLNFNYPSYSRRMLGNADPPEWTKVGSSGKTFTFFNNTFYGSDGAVLQYEGMGVRLENNLFEFNDWTAANMRSKSGGLGDVFSNGYRDRFIRNTMRFNGASAGFRPSKFNPVIMLNHFEGQCWGKIQHDGASVQTQIKAQSDALLQQNWVHSSPKYGLRFDGQPPRVGYGGTMKNNVVWKTGGMMVKGNNHTVLNNLVFDKETGKGDDKQNGACTLCVLQYVRNNPVQINMNTVVMKNAADLANGGKHKKKRYPLAGKTVLYNEIGKVRPEVVDADNMDFRPRKISQYNKHGGIGPYKYDNKMTNYWIPGRQLYKTCTPVPPNAATVAADRDALMWLNGYDTNTHHVYLGRTREAVTNACPTSAEYQGPVGGGSNVFYLKQALLPGTEYFWRVDAQPSTKVVYKGDVWSFKTQAR